MSYMAQYARGGFWHVGENPLLDRGPALKLTIFQELSDYVDPKTICNGQFGPAFLFLGGLGKTTALN
jgi:hypothetical protein